MEFTAKLLGYGPKRVVMMHGWLSDHHVFDTVIPYFPQSDYTLALIDYRGYGVNRALPGDFTVDEIAQDTLGFCDRLGWDSFHVIGHSMGGMAILKMATLAPGRVLSAVAVTPVPASGFPIDGDTRAFFESSADSDDALTGIFNTLTGERHSATFLRTLTAACRAATTRTAYLGYLSMWTGTDFSATVGQIAAPILVIAGASDKALGPDFLTKTYLSQVPSAKMTVISSAGHYPMLESPPEFFTIIENFLR